MKISPDLTDAAIVAALSDRVARQRVAANLTQAALAREAGISKSTVERLEAGAGCELVKLIRVLRVLKLIDGLDALIPELAPSPIAELKLRGRQRQRAGRMRESAEEGEAAPNSSPPRKPWTWGEK